jgi:hypothetical protein
MTWLLGVTRHFRRLVSTRAVAGHRSLCGPGGWSTVPLRGLPRLAGSFHGRYTTPVRRRVIGHRGWDIVGTWPTGQRRSRTDSCGSLHHAADLDDRFATSGVRGAWGTFTRQRGHRSVRVFSTSSRPALQAATCGGRPESRRPILRQSRSNGSSRSRIGQTPSCETLSARPRRSGVDSRTAGLMLARVAIRELSWRWSCAHGKHVPRADLGPAQRPAGVRGRAGAAVALGVEPARG